MTLEEIVAALKHFDEDWLREKKKFFELEKGYNKTTKRIEVKGLRCTEVLDDEFGNTILDEEGQPIVVDIPDFYIDFLGYCWDSDFEGALSRNNETVDEDDWIVPIYNLPQDLKTIADPIIEYLAQGIEKSRHEQVGAVLENVKSIAIDADDEPDLSRVKTRFYNKIYTQLRIMYPFFFDELTSLKKKKGIKHKLGLWHCDQICRFTIERQPFISKKDGPELLTQGKLLHLVLTTPYKEYSHLNATLRSQYWRMGDVYYLLIQLEEAFRDVLTISELAESDKLLFIDEEPLKYGSFRTFKSKRLEGYKSRRASRAERIDEQIGHILWG